MEMATSMSTVSEVHHSTLDSPLVRESDQVMTVEFRMMVFRPFKGEVITGIVHKCTPKGIYVTTQFFENIFVPSGMLFEDCQ